MGNVKTHDTIYTFLMHIGTNSDIFNKLMFVKNSKRVINMFNSIMYYVKLDTERPFIYPGVKFDKKNNVSFIIDDISDIDSYQSLKTCINKYGGDVKESKTSNSVIIKFK